MRINIVVDDDLMKEVFKYASFDRKKDLIDLALREFVRNHKRADIRLLKGKKLIDPNYDYRSARLRK